VLGKGFDGLRGSVFRVAYRAENFSRFAESNLSAVFQDLGGNSILRREWLGIEGEYGGVGMGVEGGGDVEKFSLS